MVKAKKEKKRDAKREETLEKTGQTVPEEVKSEASESDSGDSGLQAPVVIESKEPKEGLQDRMTRIAKSISMKYGGNSLMFLKDHPDYAKVKQWVSTGSRTLDWLISGRADGTGGIPVGRIIELFGDPSSGKTLLLTHVLANVQKLGGIPIMYDVEASFDRSFAERVGLDPDYMLYTQAYRVDEKEETYIGEDGKLKKGMIKRIVGASVERVRDMVESTIDIILNEDPNQLLGIAIDSVAICTTEHELDDYDKRDLTKAQALRQMMRILEPKIADLPVVLLVTNHTIKNIVMDKFKRKPGPQEDKTTPGGSGLPFGSSLRLDLTRGKDLWDKEKKHIIGHEIWCFTHKNKVYIPRRKATVDMTFDTGLDPYAGIIDPLVEYEVIEDMGQQTYRYKNERFKPHRMEKYQGFEDVVEKYPEILEQLNYK